MNTQLNEHYNRMASMNAMPGGSSLMKKWGKELGIINEAFNGKADKDKLLGTAMLLENTERFLKAKSAERNMFALNEATQASDVSFFKQFAFNNLLAVYPNLIAPDLVSTQPMLTANGEIRYIRATYGSNKGKIKKGDTMWSQYNLGDHPAVSDYSSDAIEGEDLGADGSVKRFNLAWKPVTPGSVVIEDSTGTKLATDNGAGKLVAVSGGGDYGTVTYETGAIEISASSAPAAGTVANYVYDNLTIPVDAPEINVKIVTSPITARSRKLKALYSWDGGLTMASDYGITLSAEILSMSTAQLKREIDDEVIKDLATLGTAPGVTFNKHIPEGISLVDHYAGFPAAITAASNNIWNLTQIAEASWIIVGADAANIIEAIPRFKSVGAINSKGSHLAGYLGNLPVYKSAAVATDKFVVGYKGDSLFEAGYVYAPYLPVMATQLITDETFTSRQGFSTMYGKKMTNSDFYGTSTIIDTAV